LIIEYDEEMESTKSWQKMGEEMVDLEVLDIEVLDLKV
jgi:hypothetical protein